MVRWLARAGIAAGVMLSGAAADATESGAGTGLVYHPTYLLHDTGAGHPERPERLQAIMRRLESDGLRARAVAIEARPAQQRWLERVHTREYLHSLEDAVANAPRKLDPDTVVSTDSMDAARLATGGMLAAVDAIMEGRVGNAFVAARPPGHHAFADRATGFCLINHVAVATRYIQQAHSLDRVLIIDWDVHHGNGTQDIFYADPSVLYFSIHQSPYYPGTGSSDETGSGAGIGTTVNVPLVAGSGDAEVIAAFEASLVPAAERFRPQFVLVSAGFDAHREDPLAGLELSADGYRRLTGIALDIARRHADGRLVSILEGGYAPDALARSVSAHVETLMTAPAEHHEAAKTALAE